MHRSESPKGPNRTVSAGLVRSERSESPLGLGLRTRPSDLLAETFGGRGFAVYATSGDRTWGVRPEWANPDCSTRWPSHTAAEMGPGPKVNPTAFALPAQRGDRKSTGGRR